MSPASVIISITGGAGDFTLSPMLQTAFFHGLAKAAHATNAWVITGGTDVGVMAMTGLALAEFGAKVNCIGIATWGVINNRHLLEGTRSLDSVVTVERTSKSDHMGANLDRNHTHFLLVDNSKTAPEAFGGEIAFRFALEAMYCEKKRVPRVLIVMQGGPKTLESVYEAVNKKCPVVLVTVSALDLTRRDVT